jgi:hypothetical protein
VDYSTRVLAASDGWWIDAGVDCEGVELFMLGAGRWQNVRILVSFREVARGDKTRGKVFFFLGRRPDGVHARCLLPCLLFILLYFSFFFAADFNL